VPTDSRDVDMILKEYEFLRQEILSKMDAGWKILSFETGGTSLILGFVFVNGRVELLPLVPFLILVTSFLHLGQVESVLNLGEYIRKNIEPDLKSLQVDRSLKTPKWEDFVQCKRGPYETIHKSTLCLFMGLFYASLFLMVISRNEIILLFPSAWPLFYVLLAFFAVFGVVYIYAWNENVIKKLKPECKVVLMIKTREIIYSSILCWLRRTLRGSNKAG
jgi:hypothetical protein